MAYTNRADEQTAKLAAEALNEGGLRHHLKARERKLAGAWYVVAHAYGELARVYRVEDIDRAAVRAKDWDYPTWRAAVKPEESVEVAVEYFMTKDRGAVARQDGAPILGPSQREVLIRLLDSAPLSDDLTPEQVEVLEIAKGLGGSA